MGQGRILSSMDGVISARIRLEGEHSSRDPSRLFAVLERARARSLVDLLHARPLSDVRRPEDLRKGERRIAALQLQLLRTTPRANRQRLLDEIFRAEEQLAPMTTELFSRSRRTARTALTLREVQAVLRPDELLLEMGLAEPASFAIVVSRSLRVEAHRIRDTQYDKLPVLEHQQSLGLVSGVDRYVLAEADEDGGGLSAAPRSVYS